MAIRKEVLKEVEKLRPLFEWAGREWGFPPALLAAIAVRESECGLGLDEDFLGDNGHGHGIMQVDDGSFGGLFDEGFPRFWADPMWSISTGAAILDSKWQYLKHHTSLPDRHLTWAAVAAYNCGEGRVGRLAEELAKHNVEDEEFWQIADTHTANHDYVRQVWRDAQEFIKIGWSDVAPEEPEAATLEQPAEPGSPKPPTGPPVTPPPVQPQTHTVQRFVKPTGQDLVNLFLSQEGDEYEWAAKPDPNDPDPEEGDCSGYVAWVVNHLKVSPKMPHGSVNQFEHCCEHGLEISLQEAIGVPGALLFRVGVQGRGNHVAMSLGTGSTIEAMGEDDGVMRGGTGPGRKFNHGCLVPGVEYPGWKIEA